MRASSKQAAMRAKLPSTLFTTLSQPHHTPSYLRIVLPPSRIPHPPLPQFAPHRTLTTTAPRFKRVGKKKSKRTVPFNVTKAGGNDASAFDFSDYEARIARAHSVLKSELAGIKAGGSGRDAEAIEGLRVQLVKAGNGSSGKRETVALGDVASVVSRGRNVGVIVGERDVCFPLSP